MDCLKNLENPRVIAGGQSLVPMLNFRLIEPDHLIDLSGITDLDYIKKSGEEISIGAMTTHRTVEFSEIIRTHLPLMSLAVLSVGHRQIRNRGTIGGSLCHLDPSAEMPLVSMALDAQLVITGVAGVRIVSIEDFCEDMLSPAIEPDEILSEIRFRPWQKGHGWAFTEYARRLGDFAIVAAAALLDFGEDGRISKASLTLGGVGPVPTRITEAEVELVGQRPSEELFARTAKYCAEIEPLDDPFVPGWYRQRLSVKFAQRVLREAWAQSQVGNEH
ncbi:xanthine dehydrogenase family protein subunit M [Sneathiella sp.]|uniref:FAD binding domain-containing protein n=1 Tax=Sneathiella sp. TaxID=1964365 RepID=UPI00356A1498